MSSALAPPDLAPVATRPAIEPPGGGDTPPSLFNTAARVFAARGNPKELDAVFTLSPVPMVIVDNDWRYVDVNRPARLMFRMSLAEMRMHSAEEFMPPESQSDKLDSWRRLQADGGVSSGRYQLAFPDGSRLDIIHWTLIHVLPARHLAAMAPAGWPEDELGVAAERVPGAPAQDLTPRELEILRLTAQGYSAPRIAEVLVISQSTVKSHHAHIYSKLGVPDRAGAVAKAMRLGLID